MPAYKPTGSQPEQNAGSATYSSAVFIAVYDLLVLWFSNKFAWKCPTSTVLLPLFSSAMGKRHLDIGVGTGYFPAKALSQTTAPSCDDLTLVDLNPNPLKAAKRRILNGGSDVDVSTVVADATQRLPLPRDKKFDSISLFYLLHCISGTAAQKNGVFDAVRPHLARGGVLVGATILPKRSEMNWLAACLMYAYNKFGIFGNWSDDEKTFTEGLQRNFEDVQVWSVGMVMLFRARDARTDQ